MEINRNQPEFEEINNRNLLLKIWIRPKRTLKYILENCPNKYVVILLALGGIQYGLDKFTNTHFSAHFSPLQVIGFILIMGLVAWPFYNVFALILSKVGKFINGNATVKQFRTVIAWSMVPKICSLLLLIPRNNLLKTNVVDVNNYPSIIVANFPLIDAVLWIWSAVILVKGICLIQNFKAGRALVNASPYFLTTFFIVMLLVGPHGWIILFVLCVMLGFLATQQLKIERTEQKLLKSKLDVQEETLEIVSHAIHASKNELLGVKYNLAEMNPDQPELLHQRIEEARNAVDKVWEQLKEMSRQLNPSYIAEVGLVDLLKDVLGKEEKYGKHKTKIIIDRPVYRLQEYQEFIVFSMVNNALGNIVEHARATSICMHLSFFPEVFLLDISDNGLGFDPFDPLIKPGLGILDMRAKAKLIGATLKIESAPDRGTTVQITLPLTVNE